MLNDDPDLERVDNLFEYVYFVNKSKISFLLNFRKFLNCKKFKKCA